MANTYQFDGESYSELRCKRLADLNDVDGDNSRLKRDIEHFVTSIYDLINGNQRTKLAQRGYVFLVSGTWGAGKSTTTWALVNEVEAKLDDDKLDITRLVVLECSLLPFGSASESITTFLNSFAERLWAEDFADIRAEIKQFILEVTPEVEARFNLAVSFGPISLSKPVSKTIQSVNADKLHTKFARLDKLNKMVVVILDDLDRLRPAEIVDVMRMVEKLRALPRVLVILPVYKKIVTNAFEKNLGLEPSSAATFLRKLTDAEVFVDNSIDELKQVFLAGFSTSKNNEFGTTMERYSLGVGELCWYILLHNLILEEALAKIRSGDMSADQVNAAIDGLSGSQYIGDFRGVLAESNRTDTNTPYPVHFREDEKEFFRPLGEYYSDLRDNSDTKRTTERLGTLLKYDDLNKAITKDQDTVKSVAAHHPTEFSADIEARGSVPIFTEVLLPLLQKTENEPYLTDNYKLRDMKILARMIEGDPDFAVSDDPLRSLYTVVRVNYRRFRF